MDTWQCWHYLGKEGWTHMKTHFIVNVAIQGNE